MNDIPEHMVVISEDGRYSVWPLARPLPWGWTPTGMEGPRQACLDHIAAVWTGLHPSEPE